MRRRRYLAGIGATLGGVATGTANAAWHRQLYVSIDRVHDRVTGGQELTVDVHVTNYARRPQTETVWLAVGSDRTVVDSREVTVGSRSRRTIRLGYETYPVRQTVRFPVRVESAADADERTVTVYGTEDDGGSDPSPGTLSISITNTGDPVTGGQHLSVTAVVRNVGGSTVSETVSLLVGSDRERVDAETVTLSPGASRTVTLGYSTYPVRQDVTFPVTVQGGGASDTRTVSVRGTG